MAADPYDAIRRQVADFQRQFDEIVRNVEKVVKGKSDVVRLAVTCMLADGHLLIEDVPGVGKTSLARALAETIDGSLQRIQFTPDLLPTDVTGVQIYNQGENTFEFHDGPVFANVVVADEINRASPKTQAALLEVMEEHQVTIDGVPRPVPDPFIVLATQNPIELDGTYELPEAQLDRFLMRLHMGYPDPAAEMEILDQYEKRWDRSELEPVVDTVRFAAMTRVADRVHVGPLVKEYLVTLANATRTRADVRVGVSPRGTIALANAARAWAAGNGRHFVAPDDIRLMAPHVLPHRVIITPEAELRGVTGNAVVNDVLSQTPVDETVRS
ncbi:MAG: AAA family ATPase [Candidatus Hopanoidivoransaceae bacterium]|jgi:MoxR-like ATPase